MIRHLGLFFFWAISVPALAADGSRPPAESITYTLNWTVEADGQQKRIYEFGYVGPKTLERLKRFAGNQTQDRLAFVKNLISGLHPSEKMVSSQETSTGKFQFVYTRAAQGKADPISPLVIFLPVHQDPVANAWTPDGNSKVLRSSHALKIVHDFHLKLPWKINRQDRKWSFSPGHRTHGDFSFDAQSDGTVDYHSELSVPEFKSVGNDEALEMVSAHHQWSAGRLSEVQIVASEKAGASQRASLARPGRYFEFGMGYGSLADRDDFISGFGVMLAYSYEIPVSDRFYIKPVSLEYRRIGLSSSRERPQSSDEAGARFHLGYVRDRAMPSPATGFLRSNLDLAFAYSWLDVQDGNRIQRSGWFPGFAIRGRWGIATPGELIMRSAGIYIEYTTYFGANPLQSQFQVGFDWEM
ncbi:MAG: hypothetical protein JNL01_01815 [Bdellovibrionales bacterium]|nr:hypothetical protein [Bdellovibrionales bacterium]